MIPPWLMSLNANKLIRISWRCLLQLLILLPFVMFEYRSSNQNIKIKYEIKHILKPKHIKKIFILAFTGTFWVTTILTSIQWTYISHSLVLGSLTNFYLSIQRTLNHKSGSLEKGGQFFILIGIIMVILDSIFLNINEIDSIDWNVKNNLYLTRQWWQRVLADISALIIAYCMTQLSKQTSDLKQYYPPYLSMFLNNIFTCIFTTLSAFFFNGITFDFNSKWGLFALFSRQHFTNFFYMSILLGFGVFISFVLVSKMFPDPIIPALAMTLQPIISTILFEIVGVQSIPGSFACLGYVLIIPGVVIILIGNCLLSRTKQKQKMLLLK